jgi:iron(III) transport system substrate-binding protein
MRLARLLVLLMAVVLGAGPAAAQSGGFTPDPVDLAAAKKEASVTWYTSTPVSTAQKIATMFQEQTGIRVELFRSGGSAVLRRFLQEIDARRVVADVLTVSDPAAAGAMIKRDLLVPFRPRNFDKVRDEVKDPKGYHVAQRLNVVGMVARTDKSVALPKNWTDLTDARYKGQLVMADPSYTAIQLMIVGTLSRRYGWEFYQRLRANEVMIVQGHQQVSETLTRGERLLAAEGADQYAWVDRKAGHKVQTIFPADGTFAIPAPTAVIKGSPHPHAARAFAEFMIGDAVQKLFPGEGIYAARADIEPPPGNPPLAQIKLIPVDYDAIEKESAALKKRFNEIFQ